MKLLFSNNAVLGAPSALDVEAQGVESWWKQRTEVVSEINVKGVGVKQN